MEKALRDERARGALLGLAAGDALGTTLEFLELDAPPFPELARGPHRELLGGGPFGVGPGDVTDDTQLACCLAASLRERGYFDARDVARRYVAWSRVAFDIGNQTSRSLSELERTGYDPGAGERVWLRLGRSSASNGALMRTAPIGVYFAARPDERLRAALYDAALTHFDPRCQLASAVLDAAISAGVLGAGGPDDLLRAARDELAAAARLFAERHPAYGAELAAARAALAEDLAAASRDDPGLYAEGLHLYRQQGYVRVTLRLAFWELLHAPSFEAGLLDAVNRGGDADTNGAVTGALLGALHGEAAIPPPWREAVLSAAQLRLPPGRARELYHPRVLLEMLGRREEGRG